MDEHIIKGKIIDFLNDYMRKQRIEHQDLRYINGDLDLGIELNLDSLDNVDIIVQLENVFNVRINDGAMSLTAKNFTINNLVSIFEKQLK